MADPAGPSAPLRRRSRGWVLGVLAAAIVLLVVGGMYVLRPAEVPGADEADHTRTVVAAVGDSITLGVGLSGVDHETSYPEHLQTLLGEEEFQVLNHGADNRSLLDTAQNPYVDDPAHRLSQEAEPDIVLIMLGTNDARDPAWDADAYEEQLTAFVEEYQQLGSAPDVHLMTPPPVFENRGGLDPSIVSDHVRPIVEGVAGSTGAGLIDIYAVLEDRPELMSEDGIHPSARGYETIASAVHDALTGQDGAADDSQEAGTDD